ncbi:NAC domain-containing protein JA2-like [Pistacia vera]|uniref:NAC domain-containing protein JA2-like n=1 Tax=Pistacia vera TaxID=55513 RepID=UPI001263B512|nr:NAC domain-containing protein JA2-like [Pistacia vera]
MTQPRSIESPLVLELKALPDTLKYVFLGPNKTLSVIIAANLDSKQEERLVVVLIAHKEAIGDRVEVLVKLMPTGFRFSPTDEELIGILERKVHGQELPLHAHFISETNVYGFDPQDLQWDHSMMATNSERYCFDLRTNDSREVLGRGWWRATGHVKKIHINQHLVGCKRPLSFHRFLDNDRKRNKALKTNWIMYEYSISSTRSEWRICKIKHKGKPSVEEEVENLNMNGYYTSLRNCFEASSSNSIIGMQQQQPYFIGEASGSMAPMQQYSNIGSFGEEDEDQQLRSQTYNFTQNMIEMQPEEASYDYYHPYRFDYY